MTDPVDERCECGVLLSEHPPLPKPPPMTSWMAQRTTSKYANKTKRPASRKGLK